MLIPIRDHARPERPAQANWVLIAVNVAVFAWMVYVNRSQEEARVFAEQFGLVPGRVRTLVAHPGLLLDAPWPVARDCLLPFVSYAFLHGSLLHLLGNVWFLWIFGDNVEGRLGARRYLVFYFVCGIMAGVLHVAATPHAWVGRPMTGFATPLEVPMVGASGAIAGVLGAYVVWFPRARISTLVVIFVVQMPALLFLGLWFVGQYVAAQSSLYDTTQSVPVAYWAHVGGFVTGAVLALLRPRKPAVE
jgi:membrane associated rhomboid family serine protease